ncbi:hypothetical protein MTO96_017523 [Rhipicephalus appendiculatus]
MKYSLALIAHAIVSLSCAAAAPSSPRCKNQAGDNVDWFLIYKLPKNTDGSFKSNGGEFMYVDAVSSSIKNGLRYWPLSQQDLYKDENPVAFTLAPLYEKTPRQDILYFVYNDQPPEPHKMKAGRAHSKGVVLFDNDVGVWLLHSVPRFGGGLQSGKYSFPDNARVNGQMFMCVTFKTPKVNEIARLLRTEYANVHDKHVPRTMKDKFSEVKLLDNNIFVGTSRKGQKGRGKAGRTRQEDLYTADLISDGGLQLQAYAKRKTAHKDLFEVLAKDLKGEIAVQSWRNGNGVSLPNVNGSDFSVVNIAAVIMRYDYNNTVSFSTSMDHSKWAVSVDHDDFCFSSMNRQESQKLRRGGEALCFKNHEVKELFRRGAYPDPLPDNGGGQRNPANKRTGHTKQGSNDKKVEERRMSPKARNRRRRRARTYDAEVVTAVGHESGGSQPHRWQTQGLHSEDGTSAGTNDLPDIDHRLLQLAKYTTTAVPASAATSCIVPATASIGQRLLLMATPEIPVQASGAASALPSSTLHNQVSEPSAVGPLAQEPSAEEQQDGPMNSPWRSMQGCVTARPTSTYGALPNHRQRPYAPSIGEQRIGNADSWSAQRDSVATRRFSPYSTPPAYNWRPYAHSIDQQPRGDAYTSEQCLREWATARPDASYNASPAYGIPRLSYKPSIYDQHDRIPNSPWPRSQQWVMARDSDAYGTPPLLQRPSYEYARDNQRGGNVNCPW